MSRSESEGTDNPSGREGNRENERPPIVPLRRVEVIVLGSLGGLIATLLSFPMDNVLYDGLDEILRFLYSLGLFVLIGAVWAYVHIPEHNRLRALQLGLAAPAIIAATIYTYVPEKSQGNANNNTAAIDQLQQNPNSIQKGQIQVGSWISKAAASTVNNWRPQGKEIIWSSEQDRKLLTQDDSRENNKERRERRRRSSWWERVFG